MSRKSDFIQVRLSEAGREFAGEGGQVHIANAHLEYLFLHDQPCRVGVWEHDRLLSKRVHQGKPMFEVAPQEEETVPDAD